MRTAEDEDFFEHEKELIIMLEHCGNNRFDEYLEYISSKTNNFEDIYNAYLQCRDEITYTAYTHDERYGKYPVVVHNKNLEDRQRKLDTAFLKYNKNMTPRIIKEFINGGQLDDKPINGKYKPVNGITKFMEWLYNENYEDYLKFWFFKKFIFYKNTDETIKQYLKPSNFGVKRQKKQRR